MKRLLFLLLVGLLCTSLVPSGHGGPAPARILTAAQELDENVKRMELKTFLPKLAELLQLNAEQVENALVERKISFSRLALVKLVADKSSTELAKLLETSDIDPIKMLQSGQVSLNDALERLDSLYSDVALLRIDRRAPAKSVAKRK